MKNSFKPTTVAARPRILLFALGLLVCGLIFTTVRNTPLGPSNAQAQPATTGAAAPAPAPAPAGVDGGASSGDAITPPAGAANTNSSQGKLPTFMDLFFFSPVINGILAGMSVIALGLFGFFFFTISANALAPAAFVDDVTKLVIARKHEDAANLCRANRKVFVASVIQRCAENAGKDHSVIMDMIDAEGRRRADMLWNRISYLADISNIAPMLGLLGTVVGMIKAFFGLQTGSGSIDSLRLSAAIGEAMATTMFGLIVGISALIFYSLVKARATKALAVAEQVVHSASDHIKRGT
jgi:biopolymer transport protein ExbB